MEEGENERMGRMATSAEKVGNGDSGGGGSSDAEAGVPSSVKRR